MERRAPCGRGRRGGARASGGGRAGDVGGPPGGAAAGGRPVSAPLPACEWQDITSESVSASGARLRLRALVAIGHSPVRIARALGEGVSVRTVRLALAGEPAALIARQLGRIRDLYEAWWDVCPPECTRGERVAGAAARRRAR